MSDNVKSLKVGSSVYHYHSLEDLLQKNPSIRYFPKSVKVLLENLLRHVESSGAVSKEDVEKLARWDQLKGDEEISFHPTRVLMQDFTGVPAVVDLAVMRDAMRDLKGDAEKINPLTPVDLVIDHSLNVVHFGDDKAADKNVEIEYQLNAERYSFLRWGQKSFKNFRVVPPGTGICHQVNLEYLGQVVWTKNVDGKEFAYPDSLVGTDSHTTMINGLSVLGWGVGGIEAEAAMLGQPITMLIPEVIGFKLKGNLPELATATDMVLTVTQMLRKRGVVGKFVEFFGPGLNHLSLADRATLSNMAPEYGATCGFFPIDEETINYLNLSGRDEERIELVRSYAKAQGLWREEADEEKMIFTDVLELDLSTVKPSLAGPKRPQDRVELTALPTSFASELKGTYKIEGSATDTQSTVDGEEYKLSHGNVVLAAITSCTNTSNPSVMMAAGLLAKKAAAKGLKVKPWVKTSLAPGSQIVTDYLEKSGLQAELNKLNFNLVGYGCTTCIGNSGPLPEKISKSINEKKLVTCSVLSGNRNFEGRVNPDIQANYLASPPLVVAYALAGRIDVDFETTPLGQDESGKDVFLKEIWPSLSEVKEWVEKTITREMFVSRYKDVFKGDKFWQSIAVKEGPYEWDQKSTFIKNPPYFEGMSDTTPASFREIQKARVLAVFGDSVTTDHISPAGNISLKSPAAKYLLENGEKRENFNSYGSRRGNHEVMMRGTFANIRIKNEMLGGVEGGLTKHIPSGEELAIYDAAMKYAHEKTPLVVFAGKEYGTGSSRDWAAKGTMLLGVRAVVAESFERIHRSNLIGMGVLPLQFSEGVNRKTLNLTGDEIVTIEGFRDQIQPKMQIKAIIERPSGDIIEAQLICRIDTQNEVEYFKNGGILHYVLRQLLK